MKRVIAFILAASLVFCLAACNKNNDNLANPPANSEESQVDFSLYAPEHTINENGG